MKQKQQHLKRALVFLFVKLLTINYLQAQEIKVMTYNIYHGEQHYAMGKSNLEQVAAVINQYKPDFVAMQEVDSMTNRTAGFNEGVKKDLVQELAKLTGMYGFFGKAMDYSDGGYGEGLLSKYPTAAKVYHLVTPVGGEGRALIAVKHTFPNGKEVVFAGTHLCHEFEKNRVAQAEQVAGILSGLNLPVMVGGDFNIKPESEPYKRITAKMNDAAKLFGNPALTFPYTNPRVRLDYIFLDQHASWKVKDVQVIKANASDHMPVLFTLELN
ncbi:hypothetical protein GCM10023231_34170 [Olivibacter ginsenosidimutans]|uniref:Endonuclease/exonuclease/phosphatase domain-containing protein n=1 Tax=Olivibacter ginsenosidimutans TaxID=1176537 RepID=A0ABP9BZF9_9SPHI